LLPDRGEASKDTRDQLHANPIQFDLVVPGVVCDLDGMNVSLYLMYDIQSITVTPNSFEDVNRAGFGSNESENDIQTRLSMVYPINSKDYLLITWLG